MIELLADGPESGPATLVLAHGAGAPMDSPFLAYFAKTLGGRGIRVVRFEFPYMHARREGRRPPPDREPVLLGAWREVIERLGGGARVAIGGKSLGGRMASRIADDAAVRGLVCLGYPFHPPGRPQQLRVKHLETLATPALIVQGTRDALGSRDDVAAYSLSSAIELRWIEDGDHSLRPRARSGRTEAENLAEAADAVGRFVEARFAAAT